MQDNDCVILVDCDGVIMNWLYAFEKWMQKKGYVIINDELYNISEVFNLSKEKANVLLKAFNESAAIGYLPPLRDAVHYVKALHEKHGYVFHMITSLTKDENAQKLRIENTRRLFGDTAFEKFVFLDTGADKDEALREYEGTNYVWIEDKPANAMAGEKFGLDSILIEHEYNKHCKDFPMMKNWKEVYEYLVG